MSAASVRKATWKIDALTFTADFDGGRLGGVKRNADGMYEISIPGDCEELHHKNEYRVWYCFSILGGTPGETITCRITNMHQIAKVYNSDLRPLVRVCSQSAHWERLQQPCDFIIKPSLDLQLTFQYTFISTTPVSFSFYYPFSYADCQRLLDNIDKALPTIGATTAKTDDIHRSSGTSGASNDSIYYHRELLTQTADGRRVELLTITSRGGIMPEREPYIDGFAMFPRGSSEVRPHRFKGKAAIFVSARVHPGETAASYMVHGLIALLLQPRNPYAKALRAAFVFKIVPMLNPDGVARGHFRLDQFGANLNRCYSNPSPKLQPSIYAVRAVLKQISTVFSPVVIGESGRAGRALNATSNGLFMYLDLHAYSSKQGCYLLGNNLTPYREARILTFSHLLQLYSPQFNAFACSFGATRSRKKRGDSPIKKDDDASRRRLRALEEMQYQLMFGVTNTTTIPSTLPKVPVLPKVVRYAYIRPHIHPAETSALALMAAALTQRTSVASSIDVLESKVKEISLEKEGSSFETGSLEDAEEARPAPAGTTPPSDVTLDLVDSDPDNGDDDDDSASTTSEGESDESETDDTALTVAPSIKLSPAETAEMLKVAADIFGLEDRRDGSEAHPHRALGFSLLSTHGLRVLDTGIRYTNTLPEGVRAGAADALLHDTEARKLTREWQAMKAKAAASTPTETGRKPISGTPSVGELKKGGTGRVRIHKEFQCAHSYTVECSCNLLSHAASLHRQVMFEDPNADPLDFPILKSKVTSSPITEEPLDVALYSEYARVFEQAYVKHYESNRGTSRTKPGDTVKYVRIVCPWAEKLLESQIDSRLPLDFSPPPPRVIPHPYMCQVDSLQPPIGVPANSKGVAQPADSFRASVSSSQFVAPFGVPVLTLPTSPTTCTWGTCPADPPAVFASVGRAVGFAILDLIGATCAREPGDSSIAVPTSGFHALQSRLSATLWKDVAGLHRWSRVMLDAEPMRPEDLLHPSGYLPDTSKRYAKSAAVDDKRPTAEHAAAPVPISMLVDPPSQNVDVVVFPKPVTAALYSGELAQFRHLLPEGPPAQLQPPKPAESRAGPVSRVPTMSPPGTGAASPLPSLLSFRKPKDSDSSPLRSGEQSSVLKAGRAIVGFSSFASETTGAKSMTPVEEHRVPDAANIRRIASWAATDHRTALASKAAGIRIFDTAKTQESTAQQAIASRSISRAVFDREPVRATMLSPSTSVASHHQDPIPGFRPSVPPLSSTPSAPQTSTFGRSTRSDVPR